MFIVWGKKIVHRKLGYIADFCPVCRAKQAFELVRVGSAGHVYYISAGEGELVGFERKCMACTTSLRADPATYAAVAKKKAPLPALISQTFPGIDAAHHESLALASRAETQPSSLSADERRLLIRSPFVLLSPKVEKRFASTHIDKEVALSLVGALALLTIVPGVVRAVSPDSEGVGLLLGLGLGAALVLWQALQSGRRFMRREVIPVLAKSLHRLKPSDGEIRSVIDELKQMRHKLGRKLVIADLQAQMAQAARAGA